MTATTLCIHYRRARKCHKCIWCGGTIGQGELYHYESVAYDGTITPQHWHFDCREVAADDMNKSNDCEFLPYSNDRPTGH